jgi:hypothetical protein
MFPLGNKQSECRKTQKMKYLLTFALFFFISTAVQAQQYLPGLWAGTLTQENTEYKVEIFLIRKRQKLTGRSYIYLPNGEIVEGEIKGKLHKDLSMNIYDIKIVRPNKLDKSIHFPRHFQLLYRRSFDEMKLTGYWQDWHHSAGDLKRKQGTITLERKAPGKA